MTEIVEPDYAKRKELLTTLNDLITRRNQIAHEDDRLSGRSSGKNLRSIEIADVKVWVEFVEALVATVNSKVA